MGAARAVTRAGKLAASVLVAVAVAALAAGGWTLLERRRIAREEEDLAALKAKLAAGGGDAREHHRLGRLLVEQEGNADGLAHLEIAAEREPANLAFGNELRIWSARLGQYDRCIRFLERLADEHANLPEPRLQLALAYVDKMPDQMMGIVGQGKLSKQSIAQIERILERPERIDSRETHWAALYALGMNHLYWPKALRHAPSAVEAFERCLRFQDSMGGAEDHPYFVLCHVGLGDALVKDARHSVARAVWERARTLFPADPRLTERLAVGDDSSLTDLIDSERGLGIVIDTDLSVLWGRDPWPAPFRVSDAP